ncbi:MAG TPA: NAD(P)-dependent oxidoreductase [Gammaproteobacteria bacterium]|nr:NAD(P)-dependent oxidoreductase [Gammaproteobacteria bacterium]
MKIIIPGAAGLVGQNLIVLLKEQGLTDIVAIDKHPANTALLRELHPDIQVIEADISRPGEWQAACEGGDVVVMLQAQIGAKDSAPFIANNITSTEVMLATMKEKGVSRVVHISSSVVESVAEDDYTETKKRQEQLVIDSGLEYCILRPTLMFGWFDRKHLGWLSRFMRKVPIFPIPGSGRYMRQPLYVLDFCRVIVSCIQKMPVGEAFNITGREEVDYIDIIRAIKRATRARTLILRIPYNLFWVLLWVWGLFDRDPPFTTSQLKALTAGDEFELIPWWEIFGVEATPFATAIEQTFNDPTYSGYELDF